MTSPQVDPTQPIPTQGENGMYYPQPSLSPVKGPKKKGWITSKPAIGIGALVVGIILGTAGASGTPASSTGAVAAMPPQATATATVTVTYEAEPAEDPVVDEPTEEPTEAATTEAPEPVKKTYKTLSSRGFKQLSKDPDSYIGKSYIIYGEISQFDSATGEEHFLAYTGPKKIRISYGYVDYDQNSMLGGTAAKLKKLVEGDCFWAKVTVVGSYSYDTQAGGNTTVPQFEVDSIKVYGTTD